MVEKEGTFFRCKAVLEDAGINFCLNFFHSGFKENILYRFADEKPSGIVSLLNYGSNRCSLLVAKPYSL